MWRRLCLFFPKGFLGWVLLLLVVLIAWPSLQNTSPNATFRLFLAFTPLVVLLVALPNGVIDSWKHLPRFIRASSFGLFLYTLVTTIGNLDELHNLRLWMEFVFPLGHSPWTTINNAGLLTGLLGVATQNYRMSDPIPPDQIRLIRGNPLIRLEEVFRRLSAK